MDMRLYTMSLSDSFEFKFAFNLPLPLLWPPMKNSHEPAFKFELT